MESHDVFFGGGTSSAPHVRTSELHHLAIEIIRGTICVHVFFLCFFQDWRIQHVFLEFEAWLMSFVSFIFFCDPDVGVDFFDVQLKYFFQRKSHANPFDVI